MFYRKQLDQKLARMKELAEVAQFDGREFTDAEAEEIDRLDSEIKELAPKVKKEAELRSKVDALAAMPVDDDYDPDEPGGSYGALMTSARRKSSTNQSAWTKAVATRLARVSGLGAKALLAGPVEVPPVFITPLPTAPTTLLDLIARAPYGAATIDYLRQTVRQNAAAAVPDGAVKPKSIYIFEEVSDRMRVVEHLSEPFPIRYLADYEGLTSVLDREMLDGLRAELERLMVNGDPDGENAEEWPGILNTSGVTDVGYTGNLLGTCRHARTVLTDKGITPTAWCFNSADLESIELMRENADGSGKFLVDSAAADVIFGKGLPRVASPAVPQGTALLAAWSTAQLLVREDAQTLAAQQGSTGDGKDLWETNQVRLRCEGRFLGKLIQPSALAVVHLTEGAG